MRALGITALVYPPGLSQDPGAMSNEHVITCPKHPSVRALRNEQHDTYYCKECDEWLEPRCKSTECGFCVMRPEKPSQVPG